MTAKARPTTTGTRGHILVVEDEADQQELLRYNLSREGYQVSCVEDGRAALAQLREQRPDLIVLDLMLPGIDGLEVCKSIRGNPDTAGIPIVMLTAKAEDSDVVTGLEIGADDYITKPYSPRILLARIRAVLRARRAADGDGRAESILRFKDLVIMPERFEAQLGNRTLSLSGTEFRILTVLAGKPGRVFTREQIIRGVHGDNAAVTDRSVDVHVFWLRQKLGARGRWIEAVRGVGYRFRDVGGEA